MVAVIWIFIVSEVLHLSHMFVRVSEFPFPCMVCSHLLPFFYCTISLLLLTYSNLLEAGGGGRISLLHAIYFQVKGHR